jgi:hypothetical protein
MAARQYTKSYEVMPSAARLTESLRDIGYDFPTAVADLVDNSIAAGASRVDIDIEFDGPDSYVSVADDGLGMTANKLLEALRFGTRRQYQPGELGRYGLGLKTAPLSQCRRFTVVTRRSAVNRVVTRRTLDLDIIAEWDSWLIVEEGLTPPVQLAARRLHDAPGTVVVWEKLDRILPAARQDGGWAKRRFAALAVKTVEHLSMVFHRFLEGHHGRPPIVITVNGEKVVPWNPFGQDEPATQAMPERVFEVLHGSGTGHVRMQRFVLPAKDKFSSVGEFERMSGPLKWNRQQGLYIYRADRLVQWGGWNGIRAIDEHTKLARASLEFGTELDALFSVNVAKMRVSLPTVLRQMIERPVHDLCLRADHTYRKTSTRQGPLTVERGGAAPVQLTTVGLALQMAALELGHSEALQEMLQLIKQRDAHLVTGLGLD